MSYNGSGTFVINSAGTPYVSGTVISSTAANALNSDLATGLSTAICKDGQTTVTANIPLGGFRITRLGAGTVASDAARLSQVQNSTTTTLISITGTDTITGTVSPTLTAYATGQVFSFVVAATNTGAVTLNVDSIGVKSVTRTGAVALVAGDLVTGQIAVVEYDGTRFQLINGNSFTNLKVSGTLGVTGATTLSSTLAVTGITTVAAGTAALPSIISTTGTADTGQWFPAADTIAYSTAGTERMRISSAGVVSITGSATISTTLAVTGVTTVAAGSAAAPSIVSTTGTSDTGMWFPAADTVAWSTNGTERMRLLAAGNLFLNSSTTLGSSAAFEITGPADVMSLRYVSATAATYVRFICNSNNDLYISNADFTQYVYKDYAGNTWGSSSDERLKDIIEPITDGLNKVLKLRSVIGKFKTDEDDKRRSFLIAQDVLEVLPEAVQLINNHVANREEYVLYYSDVIPLLVSAIKDLKTITEAQAIRITALETL